MARTSKNIEPNKLIIHGKFIGKYLGYLDPQKSDLEHETFFDIEILSGEIYLDLENTASQKPKNKSETVEEDFLALDFLDSIKCHVSFRSGKTKSYVIQLFDPRFSNCSLSAIINEKEKVFGDIESDISGYILADSIKDQTSETDEPVDTTSLLPKDSLDYNGRSSVRNKPRQSPPSNYSLRQAIAETLGILFSVYMLGNLLFALIVFSWQLVLVFGLMALSSYLFHIFHPLILRFWDGFVRVLIFIYFTIVLLVLLNVFGENLGNSSTKATKNNSISESNYTVDSNSHIPEDSMIVQHLQWEDYKGYPYSVSYQVAYTQVLRAKGYREQIQINKSSPYPSLYFDLIHKDQPYLQPIFSQFDSIRNSSNLSQLEFAKVLTSFVQSIPYVLLLEDACKAGQYNNAFIEKFLSEGGECQGYTKFGIHSPIEFVATLKGDCDTRTIFLFTLLSHFGYDVAILNSQVYQHSLLGINLPYKGISMKIKGKRYILWDPTVPGLNPGIISTEISNLRYWKPAIISNNISS